MFKLSKKADYGLIAVKHLAMRRQQHACSANEIAEEYGISATLMAKVLQKLAHRSLVAAKHGSSGGYQLAKEPSQRFATSADFVAALGAAFADAAGRTGPLAPVGSAPTGVTRALPSPRRARNPWPLLLALIAAAALAGAALAYFVTHRDGGNPAPTRVVTRVRTVTTQGRVRTVTTSTATPGPSVPAGQSGETLNDAGYAKMQAGDYQGALPLLEEAVRKLDGTGKLYEAYAKYNLAFTRFALGQCTDVVALLDQAQAIEGHRKEIDRLRKQAERKC